MNGTRPQTIAAALSDSPVGQLAYNELFENFGNGTSLVSVEQVLTQVSLYWLTNTSATAVRYHYAEGHAGAEPVVSQGRIGVAVFAHDFQTIRPLAERDNARSCTGRSSTAAGTTRRSRSRTWSSATCAPSSPGNTYRRCQDCVLEAAAHRAPVQRA